MAFTKADMLYSDYAWYKTAEQAEIEVSANLEDVDLNRRDGHEVLKFVNACAGKWQWEEPCIESMQNLERLIRKKVPISISTQISIIHWLEARYARI